MDLREYGMKLKVYVTLVKVVFICPKLRKLREEGILGLRSQPPSDSILVEKCRAAIYSGKGLCYAGFGRFNRWIFARSSRDSTVSSAS